MNKMKKMIAIFVSVGLCIVILGAVCLMSGVEVKRENGAVIVNKGIFSHYSYIVYADHVELLDYKGDKKNIAIPKRLWSKPVTVIGEKCFAETKIETVHLSSNIREIKRAAFGYCDFLEIVEGDVELENVDALVFDGCDLLKSVKIGNSVKRIEEKAFSKCKNLESIGEQPLLEYIGDDAFERSGELIDLQITSDVELGDSVFYDSKWLKKQTDEFVIVGNGSLIAYNGNSETVEVPYGVTKIDGGMFKLSLNGERVREIIIPDTVKELVSGCFLGCEEIRVYIPDSVKFIDEEHQELSPKDDTNGLTYAGNNDTLTIITTVGSTAQAYAEKYGIKCEIVEGW